MLASDPQPVEVLRDSIARIEAFERTRKPFRMRRCGLHLWPMVKYLLVKQTILAMGSGFAISDRYATYSRMLSMNDVAGKSWCDRRQIWRQTRRVNLSELLPDLADRAPSEQPAPVLLFGKASGFQDSSQGRVNVHHHALRTELAARGHTTLAFYAGGASAEDLAPTALHGGDVDLDPLIRSVARNSPMEAYAERFLRLVFPDLEFIVQRTGHQVADLCAYADVLAGRMALSLGAMSELVHRLAPRAVFLSNYASFYGWPMAYVCRKIGIPCIDIQHGIEGRYNGAYHWAAAPVLDWNIVPSHHLTWTQTDADLFTEQHRRRRAAVMSSHTLQFDRLTRRSRSIPLQFSGLRPPVLLFAGQSTNDILTARALQQDGLSVIFRSHPTRRAETHDLVDAADLENLHCTLADETPLTQLLETCDGLITGYSATILEAVELGKPVYALAAFARLLAEDYDDALGDLLTVDPNLGGEGLTERLRSWSRTVAQKAKSEQSVTNPFTPPDLGTILDTLKIGL